MQPARKRTCKTMQPILRDDVFENPGSVRERFERAAPFKHAIIEGFFEETLAKALLEQFPLPENAQRNPYGAPGRKAFHSDLTVLGEAYQRAHQFFRSRAFIDWIEQATGIDGLLYDETNYGGGTHENFDGRDLRPHVDFNFHPVTKFHRRLNLIVYLNEDWDARWGGSIGLHSDPRSTTNQIVEYAPSFNRCIIFETNEHSWHGFDMIDLPRDQKHRSRKSLSIYLYSRDRAPGEVFAEHTTFFVPRPLPPRFTQGYTLTQADESELSELIGHRDRLIELYQHEQRKQTEGTAEAARLRIELAELHASRAVPVMGYVRATNARGLFADGWAGSEVVFDLHAERDVTAVQLRLRTPPAMPLDAYLELFVNGTRSLRTDMTAEVVETQSSVSIPRDAIAQVRITTSVTVNPKARGIGADERDLGFFLERVLFEHGTNA